MWHYFNIEVVFRISYTSENRRRHQAKQEEFKDWGIRESGAQHIDPDLPIICVY